MFILDRIRIVFRDSKLVRLIFNPINRFIRSFMNHRANVAFKRFGLEAFDLFVTTLKRKGITYWPEFGTLLGIYRDNDFIPHDNDFDFGAPINQRDRINKALCEVGFSYKHGYYCPELDYIREDTFLYKGVGLDIFYFHNEGASDYCHTFLPFSISDSQIRYSIKIFKFTKVSLKEIVFKGTNITIPVDTHDHLIVSYGRNYMTPDPAFKSINHNFLADHYAFLSTIIDNQTTNA